VHETDAGKRSFRGKGNSTAAGSAASRGPPLDEFSDPRVSVRVRRRANVRLDSARASISRQHVKEHLFGEVRKLVPADVGNLRALPVEAILLVLHVGEANSILKWREDPFERGLEWRGSAAWINRKRFVPHPTFVANLIRRASKDDAAETLD